MGYCSLGKTVHLSSVVGWDTVAWAEGVTYMRVDGGTLYPGVEFPPLPQVNSDCVHRDEIGDIVSGILLKGFQKLQITGSSQSLYHKIKMKPYITDEVGGHFTSE